MTTADLEPTAPADEPTPPATEPAPDAWDRLSVVVLLGESAVFTLDDRGGIAVPTTMAMRSEVAIALARASAVLAAQPDPGSYQQVMTRVFAQLSAVDTDQARAAFAGLEAAVNGQTAALAAATQIIGEAIPTAPGTH